MIDLRQIGGILIPLFMLLLKKTKERLSCFLMKDENMYKPLLFLILSGIMSIVLTSCQSSSEKDIRNYYFPLKELKEGLVYEYEAINSDSLTPAYWYYRSLISDKGVYMTATYYEYDLVPLQLVKEEYLSNGMLTTEVMLYSRPDSSGKQQRIDTEVVYGNAFPFEVSDSSGVFLYKLQWEPADDPGAEIRLIKNRRYSGDTTIVYNEERYPAVIFDVKELAEYDKEGVFEQASESREIYAKGLGLAYYNKRVSGSLVWAYQLKRRYPMKELEEKYEQRIITRNSNE